MQLERHIAVSRVELDGESIAFRLKAGFKVLDPYFASIPPFPYVMVRHATEADSGCLKYQFWGPQNLRLPNMDRLTLLREISCC